MTEFAICSCLEITHLKEKSEVVAWKNNAIATFLFCINIDSSHQDRIGTVYEYQEDKASPVRYPVACFRLFCRHKRVKHNNSNAFQVDLRKHTVTQNNSNAFLFICGHRGLHITADTYFIVSPCIFQFNN